MFLLFLVFLGLPLAEPCNPADQAALLAIKNNFSNPQLLQSWNPTIDCCSWPSIGCNKTTNYVNTLLLSGDLNGTIPSSLADLTHLQVIVLVGPIPAAISTLSNLNLLAIGQTRIFGGLLESLSNLNNLLLLFLTGNRLSGLIPASMANFSNPQLLQSWNPTIDCCSWPSIGCNKTTNYVNTLLLSGDLNGTIPSSLADLTHLQVIVLVGSITAAISTLSNLNLLAIGQTRIFGGLLESLSNLNNLLLLFLTGNRLSGPIPASMANFKKLSYLDLSNNDLSGVNPNSLTAIPYINSINLGGNQLVGTIPESFGHFPAMAPTPSIMLSNNRLSRPIPARYLVWCEV